MEEEVKDLPEVQMTSEKIHPPGIIRFRIGRFLDMGFDRHDADLLANTRHDVHRVRRMMAAGCTVDLAVQILL